MRFIWHRDLNSWTGIFYQATDICLQLCLGEHALLVLVSIFISFKTFIDIWVDMLISRLLCAGVLSSPRELENNQTGLPD